jgi:peptidoglycan/xylan/chitin deacetylase (PgdA/CDA1 family)
MPPLRAFLDQHRPYFTSDGLREWRERGHSVGLHSRTHPDCSRLTDDEVVSEIIEPAHDLRRRFAPDFLPLSYPFGARLPRAVERDLVAQRVVDCALGIRGFALRGSGRDRLERAGIEGELRFPVFGRPFLGLPRASPAASSA